MGGGGSKSSLESSASRSSFDSLQEELKQGVVLRTVRSEMSMTLPAPPRRNPSEQLLFEISTFRRKKLRHVPSKNMTDSPETAPPPPPDPKSMESVMKRGLENMLGKLSSLDMPHVGSVSCEGEDTFDGVFSSVE